MQTLCHDRGAGRFEPAYNDSRNCFLCSGYGSTNLLAPADDRVGSTAITSTVPESTDPVEGEGYMIRAGAAAPPTDHDQN
ncbi:hypothetical protein RCH23_000508 [Cryobacterium sp. CAN_C3]|nr:hypothetical protein [Cryobacterium sp. CAN_C3]